MERRIGLEIRKVQQMIKHKIEKERAKDNMDLTHCQIRVLHYMSKQETPVYQKDIEEFLNVRRSTATGILNILERDGYILRKRAFHDGRLKEITITPLTLAVVSRMDRHIDNLEKTLRQNIAEEDLQVFYKVLDQLRENIESR